MPTTVLGKRQRDAATPERSTLRLSHKRRARAPQILEEEEGDPSTSRPPPKTDDDDDPQLANATSAHDGAIIRTRRHRKQIRQDPKPSSTFSPSTLNAHFRVAKQVTDENAHPTGSKTPQTVRFRDALDPSLPATPKHRVQIWGTLGTPRTPRTPRQVSTLAAAQTVYTPARQLFARNVNPGRLIGRDRERDELKTFVQERLRTRQGGCLYVSGPPGTGKSALVDEVCGELNPQDTVKVVHLNCLSMRSARDVYGKLIEKLCQDSQVFRVSQQARLKALFVPTEPSLNVFLVTLDEIDHLLTADPEILYSLFEWSLRPNSHLILIGIANALDLTDRLLPRLKAKNLKPRLLSFLPYTAPQIANVITTRLRSLLASDATGSCSADFVPFLQLAAIQLCAKKVASQTGDLRKAFELMRRAIDLVEQEVQQKQEKTSVVDQSPPKMPLVENMNLTTPPKTPPGQHRITAPAYTALTAPRASIAHIARITSSALGQGTTQRLQGLNLQQKAALCVLLSLERKRRNDGIGCSSSPSSKARIAAPTIKQLFGTYYTLCRTDNILQPLTATEFKDVISSLETMGLVGEFQGRSGAVAAVGGNSRMSSGHNNDGKGNSKMPGISSSPSTPRKSTEEKEKGLGCFVTEKEIENQISGPGEGILRALLFAK